MGDGKVGSNDGFISPLGNGKGSTMAEGASNGANNFITDPEGSAAASQPKGRDFTKESRTQPQGPPGEIDKTSVPQGGMLPFGGGDAWAKAEGNGSEGGIEPSKTPFKNLK